MKGLPEPAPRFSGLGGHHDGLTRRRDERGKLAIQLDSRDRGWFPLARAGAQRQRRSQQPDHGAIGKPDARMWQVHLRAKSFRAEAKGNPEIARPRSVGALNSLAGHGWATVSPLTPALSPLRGEGARRRPWEI